jgi:hypothetical protein
MMDQMIRHASAAYDVTVAALARGGEPAGRPPGTVGVFRLPLPGMAEIAANVALRRCGTLQECLFLSAAARRRLREIQDELRPDAVLYDMLRASQYGVGSSAPAAGVRRVVYLEDLLSDRYARMRSGGGSVLGAFAGSFPRPVAAAASLLPRLLMGLESRLAARREAETVLESDAAILVSPREAAVLAARTGGANIGVCPPYAPDLPPPGPWPAGEPRFAFVGSPKYAPNAQALRLFDAALGRLAASGIRPAASAYGEPDPGLKLGHIAVGGFAPDLGDALRPGTIMVAPITAGTGVKTKILDAMARGVPVITTALGLEGLQAEAGIHAAVAEDETGFAVAISAALADPAHMQAVGLKGRDYALRHHADADIQANFLGVLSGAPAARLAA